jgi:WD40 repeat protein
MKILFLILFFVNSLWAFSQSFQEDFIDGIEKYENEEYYKSYWSFKQALTHAEINKNIQQIDSAKSWIAKSIYALQVQKTSEQKEKLKAQAMILVAKANEYMGIDPTKALRLAEAAYNLEDEKNYLCAKTLAKVFHYIAVNNIPIYQDFRGHTNDVLSAFFSRDGNKIITRSWGSCVKLWDLSGNLITSFEGHKSDNYADISPDCSKVITIKGNTTKLWNLSGNLIVNLIGGGYTSGAFFFPDGSKIFTLVKGEIKLWDLSGNLIGSFIGNDYADISPDCKKIITIRGDTGNSGDTDPLIR